MAKSHKGWRKLSSSGKRRIETILANGWTPDKPWMRFLKARKGAGKHE